MNIIQEILTIKGVNSMFDTARVVTDLVSERLTKVQIALV